MISLFVYFYVVLSLVEKGAVMSLLRSLPAMVMAIVLALIHP